MPVIFNFLIFWAPARPARHQLPIPDHEPLFPPSRRSRRAFRCKSSLPVSDKTVSRKFTPRLLKTVALAGFPLQSLAPGTSTGKRFCSSLTHLHRQWRHFILFQVQYRHRPLVSFCFSGN
jgi:hypothetical protein